MLKGIAVIFSVQYRHGYGEKTVCPNSLFAIGAKKQEL
jgi:hypothetical protein